jgi:hypothetical protein
MRALALSALVLCATGCDTSDAPPSSVLDLLPAPAPDLAPASTSSDLAMASGDLAYTPPAGQPFVCDTMTCGSGTVCCVTGTTPACVGSCPSGSFVAQCRGPENCGGNPCCINVSAGWKVHDVTCSAALTDCPPAIDLTTGSGQNRACHVDADCTVGAPKTTLSNCCTNTTTGQHVCFNAGAVGFIQGFTCP